MRLEDLNSSLLTQVAAKFPGSKQDFISRKWETIREVAVQNAGLHKWGSHLLKLKAEEKKQLESVFTDTIHSIEEGHLHLEQNFIQMHPELIGLRFLLDQESDEYIKLFSAESAKALFWEYNPELVAQHRAHFQEVFKFLIRHPSWESRDLLVADMLIGHLISLLPFFDFEDKARIELLRYVQGNWRLVTYEITHIPLVQNEIHAYGLISMEEQAATPILIFPGTPYPAAKGFLEALWSDLHPIKSVGQEIFEKGKPVLDEWLKDKPQVDCYGMSLGGALAYHAGHTYGDQLEVHAFAAPGLIPMKGGLSKIRGRVFFHLKDLITSIGYHPESRYFTVYAVVTEPEHNFLTAHARPPGVVPTLVLKVHPTYENKRWVRRSANILKIVVSTLLFLVLLPIRWMTNLRLRLKDFLRN